MKQPKKSKEIEYWEKEISEYESAFDKFVQRGKKIIKRYKDERDNDLGSSQFNILWSNTQTLAPALYAKPPKPNIERRFQDDDPVGLVASRVLERCASYFVDTEDFDYSMKQVVLDNLLPGRGTAWVRYCPEFVETEIEGQSPEAENESEEEPQITEDQEIEQDLRYEDVVTDYVHWEDFGHTCARTWEEVRGVWRIVYMSKSKVKERFGEEYIESIQFATKKDDGKASNKAAIYEIWDKEEREVLWLAKGVPNFLDRTDDPLKLKGFFPCPKPLFATIANDNLVPVAYYVQYQDQARELDELTARIESITKAIRVAGVYDSSAKGLQSLLSDSSDNKLIAVESWAAHAEKGGLKGIIDFLPMQEIVQTLLSLYDARERVKQDLYEITGISDIVRGATKASETATAQRIKGQFATLRLDAMQEDVARFGRDLVRLIAEIVAEHFSLDTIKQISGIKLLTAAEKQFAQQAVQAKQPLPEEVTDLLKEPTWEEVEQLIRNDMTRCFRISIETDSTIKADQEAEKQARIEFLTASSSFLEKAVQLPSELAPLAGQMLMFGVRGFKTGRELEQELKSTVEAIKKKSEQPQPDPNEQAMQAEQQAKAQEAAAKYREAQMRADADMRKAQADMDRANVDLQLKQADIEIKKMDLAMKDKEITIKRLELNAGAMDTVEEQILNG